MKKVLGFLIYYIILIIGIVMASEELEQTTVMGIILIMVTLNTRHVIAKHWKK